MMKIDTSQIPGWEDRTVVLEFSHLTGRPDEKPAARWTEARLVLASKERPGSTYGWRCTPAGWWKQTISKGRARCSNDDQFCRETGRRIALKRMLEFAKERPWIKNPPAEMIGATIHQYFADRAARRRAA